MSEPAESQIIPNDGYDFSQISAYLFGGPLHGELATIPHNGGDHMPAAGIRDVLSTLHISLVQNHRIDLKKVPALDNKGRRFAAEDYSPVGYTGRTFGRYHYITGNGEAIVVFKIELGDCLLAQIAFMNISSYRKKPQIIMREGTDVPDFSQNRLNYVARAPLDG